MLKMNTILRKHLYYANHHLEIVQGDITLEQVDAIVNAANEQLAHGAGVAGIIARKGGPLVDAESRTWVRKYGPVSHAEPAFTTGGELPCKFIIHAVGPIWGSGEEDEKLASAILGALCRAEELELASIAIPAISTGFFGFPIDRAAHIFFSAIQTYFERMPDTPVELVRLVLYDPAVVKIFLEVYDTFYRASNYYQGEM